MDVRLTPIERLKRLWSAADFGSLQLNAYAEDRMARQVHEGTFSLGLAALILLGGSALFHYLLDDKHPFTYTFLLLAILALTTVCATYVIKQTYTLYLLAITLLVISGTAFVLLAHQAGSLNTVVIASVVLLFMVIPLVPWGLREAVTVISLIYLIFTLSTLSIEGRFNSQSLWGLQFLMISAGLITLLVVARSINTRKRDIEVHYQLECSRQEMETLSLKDALTGAWNRRFFNQQASHFISDLHNQGAPVHFALLDLDNFKQLNDQYGHQFGDRVLQVMSHILIKHVASRGKLIRMGGDEFALVFSSQNPETDLQQCAQRLATTSILQPQSSGAHISFSFGLVKISHHPPHLLKDYYQDADKALYKAKHNSSVVAYKPRQRYETDKVVE